MKLILSIALLALAPAFALAQEAPKKPVKAAAKTSTKAAPKPTSSRIQLKSAAKNVAAGIEAAEAALTPAEMAIAERVQVGTVPCELGTSVTLVADAKYPGYFNVQVKNLKYRMFPVETSTGAIRLEDQKAGAVWLQLGNKSMLMNQKLGQRLADDCMSPQQVAVAESLKLNPAQSVLNAPAPLPAPTASQPAVATP
nr:hypothetical protein [uncultured Albidiferax sp.]